MHNKLVNFYYFIENFNYDEIINLPKKINIIFRNYTKTPDELQLLKLKKICNRTQRKLFLANDYKLVIKLNLDGVYIPSFNQDLSVIKIKQYNKIILGSAHNLNEINKKKKQGIDILFLSPVFKKKNDKFLGIHKFRVYSAYFKKKTVILGGVNKKNLKKINILNCNNVASISYIKWTVQK
jgi:thiamine-phosphate pyrophosphorylase